MFEQSEVTQSLLSSGDSLKESCDFYKWMELEESFAKAINQCKELEESFSESINKCKKIEESFAKAINQCKELEESSAEAINQCKELEESSAEAINQCKEHEESFATAINQCMEIKERISKIKNKMKECHQTPKTNCFDQPKRFDRYVGTSEGLGSPNGWRNAPDASSYQQQFVGNGEFSLGICYPYSCDDYRQGDTRFEAQNRYQHNSHTSNSPNFHYQSQRQGQPSWDQNQYETNFQYQNQWQGKLSWEQNQCGTDFQYQSQWQGQPSWEQNQCHTDFQYQSQWQRQPSWQQSQFSQWEAGGTSSQPTLLDKMQSILGDKAPKNSFYEPEPASYGSQEPTSLPEVITPLKGKTDQLSNSFSLLDVDDNGDIIEQTIMADTKAEKKKDITSDPIVENGHQKDSYVVSSDYWLPLVWIDLEMTGLDIETDRILEIACIITDGSLAKSIEGPDIVIHQKKECLDKMGEWCQEHHAASGLTEKVTRSSVTEREAEKQVIEFVKKNIDTYRPLLAGNSVYVDLLFLKKYMPELASLFGHVLVDVSSINALCIRWFTRDHRNSPMKEKKHRAMDDIRESIAELQYYKDTIFKPSKFNK